MSFKLHILAEFTIMKINIYCLLFLSVLLFVCVDLSAQSSKDTLIRFSDLSFNNEDERLLFEKYLIQKDSSVLIDLFLIPLDRSKRISTKSATEKINRSVLYINENFSSAKSNAKKIKLTYDYIHKTFFKVYKLSNSFSEIFISGEYNCVSASALYSFIFEKTNIPFSIKEKPTHVYLYAYPNSDKILIETTSPDFGYYQFSVQFVSKYVEDLYRSKQISKEEYDSENVNNLFNKYFFSDKDISLRQLLGLQFFNYGIFSSDKKEHKLALDWFKMAYVIYPSKSVFYVMQDALFEQLTNVKYNELSDIDNFLLLVRYYECEKNESFRIKVLNEFVKIKDAQLINANNVDLFIKSHQLISSEIKDSVLRNDIDFVYWYEMSRVAILSGKNDNIDTYLYNAYFLNPSNVDLRALISHRVLNKISNFSDSKKVMDDLNASTKKYPFVKDNENVLEVLNNCYLDIAYMSYAQQKIKKGEEYIAIFESNTKEDSNNSINQRYVESAYCEACACYYRVGNKVKAKAMLLQGLKYAPDNFALKERLRQIN